MNSLSVSGTPDIGVWELNNHQWDEQEVTWLESSDGIQWQSPGASGSNDRISLLDSQIISNTGQYTWNITSAVQDSMRDRQRLDFMLEVLPGQTNANALFYSPITSNPTQMPTVEIFYSLVLIKNHFLHQPQHLPMAEWVFVNNSSLEVDISPTIQWSPKQYRTGRWLGIRN